MAFRKLPVTEPETSTELMLTQLMQQMEVSVSSSPDSTRANISTPPQSPVISPDTDMKKDTKMESPELKQIPNSNNTLQNNNDSSKKRKRSTSDDANQHQSALQRSNDGKRVIVKK